MSTQSSPTIEPAVGVARGVLRTGLQVPVLHCMYPDCGNDWIPRTDRTPKVCPKCKRYGWQTGITRKKKGKGGKDAIKVTKGKSAEGISAHLGPKTEEFLHKMSMQEQKELKE